MTETLRAFTDLPYTWQMYAGYGPPPVGSGGVAPIPANLISGTFSTGSGFINGWGNGALLPPAIHCGQRLRDPELPAGFEWRGAERHRVQQPGRRHALHRQVHHVPEPRRIAGHHREYGVAVLEHGDERAKSRTCR